MAQATKMWQNMATLRAKRLKSASSASVKIDFNPSRVDLKLCNNLWNTFHFRLNHCPDPQSLRLGGVLGSAASLPSTQTCVAWARRHVT